MPEVKQISNFKFFFLKIYYLIRHLYYIRHLLVIRNYYYDEIVIFRNPNSFPMYVWDFKTKRWEQIA